ncbi:uncharacterized protein LOC116608458 [Nematostella vectensis]|uniref:uncharacterized protein LOC116608458 n=1 Tax=Nematostella vectensis TaxID=45351 RepID=UPI0020777C8F|nr:uncharacterized protein LOC116608458 [Nematostella vectensis]
MMVLYGLSVTVLLLLFSCALSLRINANVAIRLLEHSSNVLTEANTMLGMSSRALTIDAINQMKRGEKEAAMESLNQAISTLALLDVAGAGVVQNPFTSLIVNNIATRQEMSSVKLALEAYNEAIANGIAVTDAGAPTVPNKELLLNKIAELRAKAIAEFKKAVKGLPGTSDIVKNLNKAAKWSKVGTALDAFGALFDVFAIGINAWGLDIAIRDGNVPGMVSASLGIAAGVAGVGTFLAGIITGSAIIGPIGALIGAVLGLAATLIDIFSSNPSSNMEQTIKSLKALTGACKEEVKFTAGYAGPLGKFGEIYESNQAILLDITGMPKGPLKFRKAKTAADTEGFLSAGERRTIDGSVFSNTYWTVSGSEEIGYDFYGRSRAAPERTFGVSVFVDTKLVNRSGTPYKGVDIQTYNKDYENYYVHDHVSIEDYEHLKPGQKVKISTGSGHDVIAINGLIGKLEPQFTNALDVIKSQGSSQKELTFGGISRSHRKIKGAYFNHVTERVGFYHGQYRELHEFGTVRGVVLVRGSPFDDRIIMHGKNFRVEQTRGRNTYEFDIPQNVNPKDRITQQTIVDNSDSHALIRVNHQGNVKKESFSYLDKVMIIWFRDVTGRFWNPIYNISLFCKKEPRVALIHWSNLSEKKDSKRIELIKLSKTRKRQFPGETYKFEFLGDLTTGTDRQDLVKIKKPRHRNTAVQTIDMREGANRLMLTEDLMNGYSIRPGGRTLHLKNKGGEWVLEIRDPSSSDLRHDVIIKNIKQIINEYFENVLNMRDAEPDTDLGALYMESKELIPPE